MRNLLKLKTGVLVVSISIVILITVYERYQSDYSVNNRWRQLSWDDFTGSEVLLTRFDAAIYSDIFLEYDSVDRRFFAFAGQNTQQSWANESARNSTATLRHEQYHFNITEFYARKLNKYIADNPDGSKELFALRRSSLQLDINKMQDEYDSETDHGLHYDQQMYWEYKIDSLLQSDSGWLTDYLSGARMFFPDKPTLEEGKTSDGFAFRNYELHKYGCILSMISYQKEFDTDRLFPKLKRSINDNGHKIVYENLEIVDGFPGRLRLVYMDSAGFTTHAHWLFDNQKRLFKLMYKHPKNQVDSSGFNKMAESFLESFSISETKEYWKNRFVQKDSFMIVSAHRVKNVKTTKSCFIYYQSAKQGFYNGPWYDSGGAYFAFRFTNDPDSVRKAHFILLNNNSYYSQQDSLAHLFFIPADVLPQSDFDIRLGYTIKSDSARECYRYFSEVIHLEKPLLFTQSYSP